MGFGAVDTEIMMERTIAIRKIFMEKRLRLLRNELNKARRKYKC